MTKEDLGKNLRRLMKNKGFSILELEGLSRVSRATISNILNANADPSFSTLQKIALALEVTQQELFAERPVLKSLRFRTNKNLTAREKAAKDTLLFTVYDKLSLYKQFDKYSIKKDYIDFSSFSKNPTEAAHQLREKLKVFPLLPISNFCGHLCELGIKQFYFNFGLSKTFGLSVNKEDGGPAIFVNVGTANVERWIFTMFHEAGHIILHPESYNGEIQEENVKSKEETDADDFASEFLLPKKAVYERVMGTKNFSFIEKVFELKRAYSVSYKTVLKQYCKAYQRKYNDVLPKFQGMYKNWKKHDFKDYYEPEAIEKGSFIFEDVNFRNCVYEAVKNDDLEIEKAARLLNREKEEFQKAYDDFYNRESIICDNIPF
ncbi:MAG: XRE family transcriptional regulator [Opitutales bacterium]|nr:XRE family transcriptional regulator [Opitutales bacterium]